MIRRQPIFAAFACCVLASTVGPLLSSAHAQTASTQMVVVPKGPTEFTTSSVYQDFAKNIGKSGLANIKLNPSGIDWPSGLTGSLVQSQADPSTAFDVLLTDAVQLKSAADQIANIVKDEPADRHSVLFDLQKKYQVNRTYKITIPKDPTIFASFLDDSRLFQSSASSSILNVNEALALALEQASQTTGNWLDKKTVPFMASSTVLSNAAIASPTATPLAKSYSNVITQFGKAIDRPSDPTIMQAYVDAAAQFKADYALQWPAIKNDPVARNAAATSYNGLATQRVLKAQYGVLTNFPPLSYEQVFYFSRQVVTLKYGGSIICSALALTKRWIVSAGHCFSNRPWTDVRVVFDLDGLGVGSRPLSIVDQWPEPAPGSKAQDDIDFTFIRVEDDATVGAAFDELEGLVKAKPYSAEPLCITTSSVNYKQPVFAVGFPMGQAKTVHDYAYVWFPFKIGEDLYNQMGAEIYAQAYKTETELGVHSYADTVKKDFEAAYSTTVTEGGQVSHLYFEGAFGTAKRPSFGIDTDTSGGDSGSPIFDRTSRCLVGIFSSGQRDTLVASEASWREHEVAIPIAEILKRIRAADKTQTFGGRLLDANLQAGRDELLKRLDEVTNNR